MTWELITRRGCHLCDDAATSLRSLGVDFGELDVDADPELLRLYDFRVPVVLRDGDVVAEGKVSPETLRRLAESYG